MFMNITLMELKSYSFDSSAGGVVTDTLSNAEISIPGGAFMYGDGTIYQGEANV